MRPWQPMHGVEHYVYRHQATTAANFTAGTVLTPDPLRFTDESRFVCTCLKALARFRAGSVSGVRGAAINIFTAAAAAGDNVPDAPFQVRMITGGTDRRMDNNPIDAWLLCGIDGYELTPPKLFEKNQDLTIEYTLLKGAANAADALDLTLLLCGYKIYDQAALNLTALDTNARRV